MSTSPVTVSVDAGPVARVFEVGARSVRTVALRLPAGAVAVAAEELVLVVDGGALAGDDLAVDAPPEAAPDGSGLSWQVSAATRSGRVTARIVVTADRAAGVVRKHVEVTGAGRLDRVQLEDWDGMEGGGLGGPGGFRGFASAGEAVPPNSGVPGLGQPVLGPGLFAGIEHPGAENLVPPGGGCRCSLDYAVELDPSTPVVTPPSVIGSGPFRDYLDGLRPQPDRMSVLTNNWYHLGATGEMDERSVTGEVERLLAVTTAAGGPDLDFYCLDDGWDGGWEPATGLWGRLAPDPFPGGLPALEAAAGPGRIGLWIGPFGGYGERQAARVAWSAEQGHEVDDARGILCVAGARYREALGRALVAWTAAGVGYWKLDGVSFACDHPGHGHPAGPGGRTAQMDAFRSLLDEVRAVRPDVVIAFTSGSNPSPWWLPSADFLWRGGLDDDAASEAAGSARERFATYIDSRLHLYRPCAVPVSALVTFSLVQAPGAAYADADAAESAADWERHCWLMVGRGTLHHDLYVAPDSLTADQWRVVAGCLAWARRSRRMLARSRMVLGSPAAGEVYGFAGERDGRAFLCLRNPAALAQRAGFALGPLLGLDPAAGATLDLEPVWGSAGLPSSVSATDRLEVDLDPFAVVLLTLTVR